jgi:hypothetical protein
MWYIYLMEYYPSINKNEMVPFVGKWVELEIIILSEINQIQKDKYHIFSLICRI